MGETEIMSDQQPPQGYGQPAPGQAPPPGYYQQEPPKKKHTVRNILLGVVLLFVLIIGGCMALIGGAANEIDKAILEEEANDKPVKVEEGAAFTHDGFEAESGWKVAKDGMGSATIKGLSVTNTDDEGRTALLSFRFYKGNTNLGEVECSSNTLQGGESSALDCVSFDSKFPTGYTEIRVSDSF